MVRLLVAMVATIAVVGFSVANMEHVELDLVVVSPTRVRLFFLLLSAFVLGIVVTLFVSMISRIRLRTRLRAALQRAQRVHTRRRSPTSAEAESE